MCVLQVTDQDVTDECGRPVGSVVFSITRHIVNRTHFVPNGQAQDIVCLLEL